MAAEKPPDAPSHEADGTNVFINKDDFLFDPFDPWKGSQGAVASENDVFLFDESTSPPPERSVDLQTESEQISTSQRPLTFYRVFNQN